MQVLKSAIEEVIKDLFNTSMEVVLTRPDEQFGDYATNVALQLAKQVHQNPREVADAIKGALKHPSISQTTVAGPGFINIRLVEDALIELAATKPEQTLAGQQILVEFGDANPFKAMHLGHLYTTITGDTIAHLLEAAGADVIRVSYHGDVGMHVAKAIYGIGEAINWEPGRLSELEKDEVNLNGVTLTIKTIIGYLYAQGAKAYEANPAVQARIREINKCVYARDDQTIDSIYDWGVKRSFAYFDLIFDELGVTYARRYLESECSPIGIELVKQNVGKVFEKSDGAIVFRGEKRGLHTRVFINSEGLPTYEAKDLGLAQLKNKEYPNAARSIIITANEQAEYFKVMLAAMSEVNPPLAAKTSHISHGFLSLTTGKMSSRTGEVFNAEDLLDSVLAKAKADFPDSQVQPDVYLAAVKYAFVKNRIGGDIVFDVEESVSILGNSGPYLQYAHARARSILAKAEVENRPVDGFESAERSLLRKLGEFNEVVTRAIEELMPHHVCTYLYELAQNFNRFYEKNRVLGDPRQAVRLQLVQAYADTLKNGLSLLNIPAPEKM